MMPPVGQSECSLSLSPMEDARYAELQPVSMEHCLSSLITSSTNMCLPVEEGATTVYLVDYPHHYTHPHPQVSGEANNYPHSPQSDYDEDLSDIQEMIERRMTGSGEDDGDDASVMFDFMDLDFLDQLSTAESDDVNSGCGRHNFPLFDNIQDAGSMSFGRQHRGYPTAHQSWPESTATTSSATSTTTLHSHTPTRFCNIPTTACECDGMSFPPTPSPSPRLQRCTRVEGVTSERREGRRRGGVGDQGEEEDAEFKPYCNSRRGAKKNLLWKFLLWVLDHHSHLAQWNDVTKGEFRFVDTVRISQLWGQRKQKRNMTFEKLSRGIRHYYRRGLMERLPTTRLVYKFNWEKVPRSYRKA